MKGSLESSLTGTRLSFARRCFSGTTASSLSCSMNIVSSSLFAGRRKKSAVNAPGQYPLLYFCVIAEQQLVIYVWVILLESLDDVGQPVRGCAGKCSDADEPGLQPVQLVDL
jgi:hypothetical protein